MQTQLEDFSPVQDHGFEIDVVVGSAFLGALLLADFSLLLVRFAAVVPVVEVEGFRVLVKLKFRFFAAGLCG
jgi:hypothetical protein